MVVLAQKRHGPPQKSCHTGSSKTGFVYILGLSQIRFRSNVLIDFTSCGITWVFQRANVKIMGLRGTPPIVHSTAWQSNLNGQNDNVHAWVDGHFLLLQVMQTMQQLVTSLISGRTLYKRLTTCTRMEIFLWNQLLIS